MLVASAARRAILRTRTLASSASSAVASDRSRPVDRTGVQLIVEQLLRTVGTKQDVDQYMQLYGGLDHSARFAVIKVGGEVIRDELDTFAGALTVLHRIGLCPIVVHGAGPQMNEKMEARGVEPSYIGGLRVTDAATLQAARDTFLDVNLQLVRRLEALGTPARPMTGGVFEAEPKDPALGLVGEVTRVDTRAVTAAVRDGYLPVVMPLAETPEGQILNINADVAAREMALTVKPLKTIFINAKGGWVEPDGRKLGSISMSSDYEEMASRDYTGRQGTLLKLNELKLILDSLPPPSSISLTSAEGLVRELFTHHGAGTLVHHGDPVRSFSPCPATGRLVADGGAAGGAGVDCDVEALERVLGASFGQQLFFDASGDGKLDSSIAAASDLDGVDPSDLALAAPAVEGRPGHLRPGYLQALLSPEASSRPGNDATDRAEKGRVLKVYKSDLNRAAAVVTAGRDEGDPPYLCKFAVTEQAMGEGTAGSLWSQIVADFPRLYWRSHTQSHDINSWFFERADGMQRTHARHESRPGEEREPWTVYWRGIKDGATRQRCIDDASSRPRSYLSDAELEAWALRAEAGEAEAGEAEAGLRAA